MSAAAGQDAAVADRLAGQNSRSAENLDSSSVQRR